MTKSSASTERLIRALERGGCVTALPDGEWGVWRGRDLRGRCIGRLPAGLIQQMRAEGKLALRRDSPSRLFWAGEAALSNPVKSRPITPAPLGRKLRRPARNALELALASIGDEEVRAIAKAAARRFEADVERSASGQRVTQNWDTSLHVDGAGGAARDHGGRGYASQRASGRLARLANVLADDVLAGLMDLVVYRRSLSVVARRQAVSRDRIAGEAGAWLKALAVAYGLLRSDSPV